MNERCFAPQWPELDLEGRTIAFRQIGNALAKVNSLEFDQHAEITGYGADGLVLNTGLYTEVLVKRINETRSRASSDRFDSYFDKVITAVMENQERLNGAPATLIHSDPAMPNIFRSETTLGFIDWELAHIGDPARELHRAQGQLIESRDFEGKEQLRGALRDGYRQVTGRLPPGLEERTPIYDAVRFLGTAGFFDKVVKSKDESADEYASWVEAEFDRRLDEIR